MGSSAAQSIWYMYGIVPGTMTPAGAPSGLDDVAVSIEREGGVAALVSVLEERTYAPDRLEITSGDVEWLSPRAVAHDLVLTWASDRGPVIPLPMFSMFSGPDAVREMLRQRSAQLSETLARVARGREYALRVYRVDSELLANITSMSDRLRELAANAAAASPGQRYLLERKLDVEKKTELRAVSQRVVEDVAGALAVHALEVVRSPIARMSDADAAARGTMVLNAAFLLAPAALESFQRTLTELAQRLDGQGFRFDFTGPWPPYHFTGESTDGR